MFPSRSVETRCFRLLTTVSPEYPSLPWSLVSTNYCSPIYLPSILDSSIIFLLDSQRHTKKVVNHIQLNASIRSRELYYGSQTNRELFSLNFLSLTLISNFCPCLHKTNTHLIFTLERKPQIPTLFE